jgi:ATP-dependent DNA helicase UvrD/PcrA
MATFAPSAHQLAIRNWIRNGRGNAVIEAVAGSGKTWTLVEVCAPEISGRGLFVAFNKHAADNLALKLQGTMMEAKTVHGVGFGAINYAAKRSGGGKVRVEENKYKNIVRGFEKEVLGNGTLFGRKLTDKELEIIEDERFPISLITRLVDLARVELLDSESPEFSEQLMSLVDHHALEFVWGLEQVVCDSVRRALMVGKSMRSEIDFTDMIWFPVIFKMRPFQFSWVFVDEAQDLSKCQLALVRMCVAPGGRMVAVGDRRQAIYGFAGADAYSFQRIIDDTDATVLPLSVCYRCPTQVLDLARKLCPQIEAAPGAGEGIVRNTSDDKLVGEVREGDMILCRYNAPLLGVCFELIADGISASVRGRDIGKGLCRVVDVVSEELQSFAGVFGMALSSWEAAQVEAASRRGGDEDAIARRCEFVRDQAECIRVVYGKSGAKTAEALKGEIEKLFNNERPSVVLSSIHRAKGLEEDRVFILDTNMRKAQREWMQEQENNLVYVSYTRAKKELVFVSMSDRRKPKRNGNSDAA